MREPPNNRFKAPFFTLTLAIGVLCAVIGAIEGSALLLAWSVGVALASGWLLRVVRSGRNPRWLRSPLDR